MTTVAIISDTHGLLRNEVIEYLKTVDVIIHAGDINTREILEQIQGFAPLYIVRGNNDKEWAKDLPVTEQFTVDQVRIFLVHNKKDIPMNLSDIDLIIYGHSHKYEDKIVNDTRMINPGSCGKRRFNLEITMALLRVENQQISVEKIVF